MNVNGQLFGREAIREGYTHDSEGLAIGFTRFGRTKDNAKTCEACRMAYDGEIAAASSRSKFGKCSSR